MPFAVDYSYARPGGPTIAGIGAVGALRYVSYEPGKDVSAGELADLYAHGLRVGLVWETTANMVLRGTAGGHADGAAFAARVADLNWHGAWAHAAIDFQISGGQFGTADTYFDAFNEHYPVRPYGYYDFVEHWYQRTGQTSWQCAAWSGNGNGSGGSIQGRRVSAHAHLFQRVGYVLNNSCDTNDVLSDSWGQWHPDMAGAPLPVPTPTPNPTPDPVPAPPEQDWFTMATLEDLQGVINQAMSDKDARDTAWHTANTLAQDARTSAFETALDAKAIKAVAQALAEASGVANPAAVGDRAVELLKAQL